MKTSKRFLALVLSALMIFSVVIIPGVDLSMFSVEADAAITLDGITQQRVVGTDGSYASTYAGYQSNFFKGADTNWPTNFVIPGLSSDNDYTPQGMTYWEEKEWILISAYYAGHPSNIDEVAEEDRQNSVIYAIDAVTTDFVALFKLVNANGTKNVSHGGGIAASKYNFYYADNASKISYVPLSEMDVPEGTIKEIKLVDCIDCSGELNGASTSYCCYEDGVLWTGNFYLNNNNYDYGQPANSTYNSMLFGYKLHGNSSAEEWYYLSTNRTENKAKVNTTSQQTVGTTTFTTSVNEDRKITISGSVNTDSALSEATASFGYLYLVEGKEYVIEFIADNNLTDMYMFAPTGNHCNVKQSQYSKITALGDGRYHYTMTFTAGLKPTSADSSWPTTQSTNEDYTGKYTIRFDQDSVPAGGRSFTITDFSVTKKYTAPDFEINEDLEGINCEGNPTFAIAFDNLYDKIQYAMVDKGKIYASRSWSRNLNGSTHTRALAIADLDIYSPGTKSLTINNQVRDCHFVEWSMETQFGLDNNTTDGNDYTNKDIFAMGEALCIMNDYLYMFAESAAWHYNGKDSSSVCSKPIDVIWKIDQHALTGTPRPVEEVPSLYYEKIADNSQIVEGEEYILVFEAQEKDPVTQKNILYAVDSYGGYDNGKLPKKSDESQSTAALTADSRGIIGYPITDYSTGMVDGKEVIYLNETDDSRKSIRWTIAHNGSGGYSFLNSDFYYGNNRYLCFAHEVFTMNSGIEYCGIVGSNGNLNITDWGNTLWCNPGYTQEQLDEYTNFYKNHGITDYVPVYNNLEEIKGTFHIEPASPSADEAVADDYKIMHIYKKVKDPYTSTLETDVYTNTTTTLEADGTYTINLETYATAAVQYMQLDSKRPTDFIFVLDNSTNMSSNDVVGYYMGDDWNTMSIETACGSSDHTKKPDSAQIHGYDYHGGFYYKTADGRYNPVYAAIRTYERGTFKCKQSYWVYYKDTNDGLLYMMYSNGSVDTSGITMDQLKTYVTNNSNYSAQVSDNDNGDRKNTTVYQGPHYAYQGTGGSATRMHMARDFITRMTYKIAADNSQHRVSLITYGNPAVSYLIDASGNETNKTALDTNGDGTISSTEKAEFNNAFYENSEFGKFRSKVNAVSASSSTGQPSVGMSRAANTVVFSDEDYTPTGKKSAVIFLITGADGLSEDTTNAGIKAALDAKKYSAFVYTVKIGNASNSYSDNFYNFTSSNYVNAESISKPGEQNRLTTGFNLTIPYGSYEIENKTVEFLNTATEKSTMASLRIDEKTIIQENIGEFFLTSHLQYEDFTCYTVDAQYDGLGRLYFDESTTEVLSNTLEDSTYMTATDSHTLQTKGFDFSENYIAESHPGKKLVVTVKGLLLNPDYDLANLDVTNADKTGLYLNQEYLADNNARKRYPVNTIHVPEYTYVLDYGIGMLDTDVNGTLCSIDDQPRKQSTYKTALTDSDDVKNSVIIKTVNGNQDLVYGLKPDTANGNNSGYCLIKRPDETYDWFKINVVPASNVYFEEELATPQVSGNQQWILEKDNAFDFSQNLTSTNDVYGYDSNYRNEGAGFSHGSVYKSEVNDMNLRSDTLKFDYTGTAIDLYGSCGEDTGIYIITVRREDGSVEKVYITDTYLSDSSLYGNNHRINQVPIVHHENTNGFGKYTVEVTSAYLNSMVGQRNPVATFGMRDTEEGVGFYTADFTEEAKEAILMYAEMEELLGEDIEVTFCDENSVLNGGTGADVATTFGFFSTNLDTDREFEVLTNYFDGFRVYQPTFGNHDGNYPEYEQGAQFFNVAENLLTADEVTNAENTGIAFIEKIKDSEYEQQDYGFSSYTNIGPKNELYLQPGKSIAINVFSTSNAAKAMISLRAINGVANATIAANNGTTTISKAYTVDHVAEMYYRIDGIEFSEGTTGTITITNTSSNILVVDTVKLASGLNMGVMMMSAMPRIRMMMAAPAEEAEPNTPETEEIPDIPTPEAPPVVEMPEGPSTTPEGDTGTEEEKDFIEQITENFTKLLNMIQSMLERIVNLLKSLMA